jgi:hypothetical protein
MGSMLAGDCAAGGLTSVPSIELLGSSNSIDPDLEVTVQTGVS